MKYEYKTTHGDLAFNGYEADNPVEPIGDGWELISTTASTNYLYWTWRRPKQPNYFEIKIE